MPDPWEPRPEGGPVRPPWKGPAGRAVRHGRGGEPALRFWLAVRGGRVARCEAWAAEGWFDAEETRLLGAMVEFRIARSPLLTEAEILRELGQGREPGRAAATSEALDEALADWSARFGGTAGRAAAFLGELREAVRDAKGEPSYRGYKLR
ncbi:hypothetical protein L6R50_18545 [Myxococcota bacterium]|nr:hypothetical protein [Myxococcota bacterium]